ncbi:NAD(P)-dependent oxidoreductase [Novosphingobium sp.]|uniref:NAD(P)-dependent oxidoreductase n=1 Tax=Novosphingobium sp. TaxID=1874826 RepID=UPI002B4935E8|nr:NAD(P)-dependent oxidoreductase [Novosphingobium sp.]HKR92714.1 NAD(P)-dependent oxidoreductase [Novosphingobium sp.]
MPLKLLSVLEMPERVADRFRARTSLVQGRLEDAADVQPDAILCSIGPRRFDREVIRNLPASVKAIATYSVGYDHIDLQAAADRGIAVFNTPGVLSDAVADAALLLILGAARRATENIALLREGRWTGWSPAQLVGEGLSGKTLGIFGMGNIGRKVASRARAFGMRLAYHGRSEAVGEDALFYPDPRALIADCDIAVLAWPSTPETRYFIAADTLCLAKPSLILVNIGRGDLVKDEDLIAALRDGKILAAGLDVFDNEPQIHPGYLDLPNAFLLPHIGSSTWEARLAMADVLLDALETHACGGQPHNRIA